MFMLFNNGRYLQLAQGARMPNLLQVLGYFGGVRFDLPSAAESRPDFHHLHAHRTFGISVSKGSVERPSKDKFNLVTVHDAGPVGPGVSGGTVREVVQVWLPAGDPVPADAVEKWFHNPVYN